MHPLFIIVDVIPWLTVTEGIIIGFAMLSVAILCLVFIVKKPDRNYAFGFRTKISLSSDEIWYSANKIAIPVILSITFACLIADIVVCAYLYINNLNWGYMFIVMAVWALLIILFSIVFNMALRVKFRNYKEEAIKEIIENDQSRKQDIDDFWK